MLVAFVSCTIAENHFAFAEVEACCRMVVATVLVEDDCTALVAHRAVVYMVAAAGALEVVASFAPSSINT